MKKITILIAVLVLLSGSAFAATLTPDATKTDGAIIDVINSTVANVSGFFNFSKGVYAGAETNEYGYAMTTAHENGSKYFGTGYDATAIFVKSTDDGGKVMATLEAPTSSVASESFTEADGWTKL